MPRAGAGRTWRGASGTSKGQGWPFTLKGRLDRLDYHPENGDLIVWDYKTGEIPGAKKVFEEREEFQLPGYLLAVKQGRVEVAKGGRRLGPGSSASNPPGKSI